MFKFALLVLIVAALFVTPHAAPEAAKGSRASPAAAQSAPTSQKTAETSAPEPKAAPAQPAAARAKTAAAPAESTYSPLPADSTEFHLMQQIRGNLNGFDCDALVSDIKSNAAFAGVTRLNLAESKMSDACAAQVFSLLNKMPQLHHLNCHRCAVSSAGVSALARHLSPGTSKITSIDLIWNDLADSDVQALADALDSTPHFVQVYTDHNPKCHNANHILRSCKNHKGAAERQQAVHTAALEAEAARQAAKRDEQIKAAAAAVKQQQKQQQKVDKTAAGTL